MKKNKELIIITSDKLLELCKKESKKNDITFLFPLESFSIGFPKTYKIEEIKEEAFILINRILDNEGIKKVRESLKKLPSNIKGIVFDDLGILNILIDLKLNIKSILYLNHMNCNSESINTYLQYVDSVVISSDITKEETKEILKKAKKPLVLFSFGHVNIMYSRRTLISNYNRHFKENAPLLSTLEEKISHHKLKIIENQNGTVIYTNEPFNNLSLDQEDNIYYLLINPLFLKEEEIIAIINRKDNLKEKYTYDYLSLEETIFNLKEKNI